MSKISALPTAADLTGDELIVLARAGSADAAGDNIAVTLDQLVVRIGAAGAVQPLLQAALEARNEALAARNLAVAAMDRANDFAAASIANVYAVVAELANSIQLVDGTTTLVKLGVAPVPARFTDSTGRSLLERTRDGRLIAPSRARGLYALADPAATNRSGIDGYPVFIGSDEPTAGVVATGARHAIRDDYEHVLYVNLIVGQSLAGGANDNNADLPLSVVPVFPGHALMPAVPTGAKPGGRFFDQLADLVEVSGIQYDTSNETMASGLTNGLIARCVQHLGVTPYVGALICSQGARTWDNIRPGNIVYRDLAKALGNYRDAAAALGKTLVVAGVFYVQGEQDRGSALQAIQIQRNRLNMRRAIGGLVREITKQDEEPAFFLSQPNNSLSTDGLIPDHMMAPLELDGVEGLRLLPPHYPLTMSNTGANTGVHPDSASYRAMGDTCAEALWDEWFGPGYWPVKVVDARWMSATQVDLVYSVRTAPIVIDLTGTVVAVPTWPDSCAGYQCFDGSGSPPAVTAATVVADGSLSGLLRIVRLTLSKRPTGPYPRIHYATRNDGVGDNSGRITGPRGCVRDSGAPAWWASSQVVPLGHAPMEVS